MLGFSPCGGVSAAGMYTWSTLVLLLSAFSAVSAVLPPEPTFAEIIPNITITAGREAILHCVVDDLGVYRVAWIKVDTQTVLTYHTYVISHNSRISINHNGLRNWDLHIKQIQESDQGLYMCQINYSPMKNQLGNIEVVVPPDIIYDLTSSDLAVGEGLTATLVCKANGSPPPKISWRREDGSPLMTKVVGLEKTDVLVMDGDVLTLNKVTRKQMGVYLCIASNNVPPAVSKRIHLQVNFGPTIKVSSQMVSAPAGGEVVMECSVEASPKPVNYWMKKEEAIFPNEKYEMEQQENAYKMYMQIKIRHLERNDFGPYKCVAKNPIGEAQEDILLHELEIAPVKSKVDSQDSRIGYRAEEHIGGTDSSSHYITLDSKRNPANDDSDTPYTDKEYGRPRGDNDSENDVQFQSPNRPQGGDTASSVGRCFLAASAALWWSSLCVVLISGRTASKLL